MSITENYQRLRTEIPDHVTIVLACKTRTPEEIREAIEAGATDVGENYVQEAEEAYQALGDAARRVRWHVIGHLQTNKINKVLPICNVIQTVESFKKAKAIDKRAERVGKVMPVYIEINVGGEENKSGMPPEYEEIERLARQIISLKSLSLEGIMTMGPLTGNPEDSRPYFRQAKQIFDALAALNLPGAHLQTLSMGMSDSYEVAIEEGATMVRLGTIVFGPRS